MMNKARHGLLLRETLLANRCLSALLNRRNARSERAMPPPTRTTP